MTTDKPELATAPAYAQIRDAASSLLLGDSLKARVLRGGAWLGSGSVAEQAARFGRNMILTRLLAPEAFGTMAIVLATTSVLQSFTDIGVREGLVQNPRGGEDHYVNAAWWLGIGRALSLAAVLFAVAPLVAVFYANAGLTALLRFSTLGVVLAGASSPRAHVAMKEMKFGRLTAIGTFGGIFGVALTLILSFTMRNVWALVIGSCAESAARCLLSFVLCPCLPSPGWDKEAARDLLRFSRGLFGLSFLNLIFARADIFVLAKLFSPAALGLYTMATYLVVTPTSFIMNTLGQTLLPAFSQIQDHPERTNRIVIRVTSLVALLGLPALAFIFLCGRSLLTLTYGPKYSAAAVPLMIAGCVALFNIANGLLTVVFYSLGLPNLHRRSVVIAAVIVAVLVYPLSKWTGPAGGQLACLIAIACGFLFQLARTRRLTGLNLSQYAATLVLPALISFSMLAICLAISSFARLVSPISNMILGFTGCALAYSFILLRFYNRNQKMGVAP
ncbi:MAG: oligosaccharide flippase family protein [Terriglobia bacterium]